MKLAVLFTFKEPTMIQTPDQQETAYGNLCEFFLRTDHGYVLEPFNFDMSKKIKCFFLDGEEAPLDRQWLLDRIEEHIDSVTDELTIVCFDDFPENGILRDKGHFGQQMIGEMFKRITHYQH